jgi:hypothetical protein
MQRAIKETPSKWIEDQKDNEEDIETFIVTRLNSILTEIHSLLDDLEKRGKAGYLKKDDFNRILGCYNLADEILYSTHSLKKYFKDNNVMMFIDNEDCRRWCEMQRNNL